MDGLIVHTNDSLRAIAPEMTGRDIFANLVRKSFLGSCADVQAFRPQMFAKCLVHGINLSV
jgi:hypothetical protein